MQKGIEGSLLKTWVSLANRIMPIVLITYILRKLILLIAQVISTGRMDLGEFANNLTLRSEELSIIVDSILKLQPGQQYYFGSPSIDGVFPVLGGIALLAWQMNVVMKWAQYKLLGKESGLTGVFTPIIDLGMIRLFFLMAIPITVLWFFNPLMVQHPISYPYSLVKYFESTSNNAGVLVMVILLLIGVNSPLIARLSGAPGLIVHGKTRVIDSIANSFKMVSTLRGLSVIIILLIIAGSSLYISAPGSVLQYPVTDLVWLQWLIKAINILGVTLLWSLGLSGLTLLFYENSKKLDRYH